jgi:uncharacterized hydrophobic protein (TIGR00271 family)
MNIIGNFKVTKEKEDYELVIERIDKGVVFKGTNLWILVFAIFIASLGLNVNSPSVIIGAMLISPLMGPIMGIGLGMAINDLVLLRKALFNYLFAGAVGLATSTIYFLMSPINDAHSEILARISPNIYDVLIALLGGFAGVLATSSKQKGNVIQGVAIATALMPPLCTAGYGLATLQFQFFFGAFYLFIINTVFIALATLITTRLLKFPFRHLPKKEDEIKAKRIVWALVIITLLPSIYFGYDLVQQNKFNDRANTFIDNEAVFPNDYLLKKDINSKKKTITLTYGGQIIEETEIKRLKSKLPQYGLTSTSITVQQGFAYLKEKTEIKNNNEQITMAMAAKERQIQALREQIDSLTFKNKMSDQIFKELKIQYPDVQSCILQTAIDHSENSQQTLWIGIIRSISIKKPKDKTKIENWLKLRLNIERIRLYFEYE